jgi:hypothetical protein
VDEDQDGFTTCQGDCDDQNTNVNPGAYDFPNTLDDDCDGTADNAVTDCGAALSYTSQLASEYARALDLCQTTTPGARTWGLLAAEFARADGTGTPAAESHAIVAAFGDVFTPRGHANMVLLSTGLAAAPGQPYADANTPQPGTSFSAVGTALPPGFPQTRAGCPLPSALAYDAVSIKLTLRVPTNAGGLSFNHAFFSAEYPEDVCTARNDTFAVLVDGAAPGIPADKNVLFDFSAPPTPGSVNTSFVDRCVPSPTGCSGTVTGSNFCAGGTADLVNTGFGTADMQCGAATSVGASTGWLTTEAPVVGGETLVLQFVLWDSSDPLTDSMVLLDNFRWMAVARNLPITH